MSHLPDISLKTWKPGEGLSAAALNSNFAALLGLIEMAMVAALTPDPAAVGNEVAIGEHARRLELLEGLVQMHARQRNERELTPLATTAAVMQQVRELREPTQDAQARLMRAHNEAQNLCDGHAQRLAELEGRPAAATAEQHDDLARRQTELEDKLTVTLAQAIALRHEVGVLHRLALGLDREANRREYAPMATVAHLLQRIMALEARP